MMCRLVEEGAQDLFINMSAYPAPPWIHIFAQHPFGESKNIKIYKLPDKDKVEIKHCA